MKRIPQGYAIAVCGAVFFAMVAVADTAFGATTAVLESKLTPTIVKAGQRFGDSVSISNNTAVIGAPMMNVHDRTGESDIGYVFVRSGTTWTSQGKLTLLSGTPSSIGYCFFCHSMRNAPAQPLYNGNFQVAVSGDTALAAAEMGYSPEYQVRIFERNNNTWTEKQTISMLSGAASLTAPIPVAVQGDTIALGTTASADVYVRSGSAWTLQQNVGPSDLSALTQFGRSLALNGNTLAVAGASASDTAVYVFVRNGSAWTEEQKILLPTGAAPADTWFPLGLSNDTLLIGAPDNDNAAGAVYVYERSGGVWTLRQTLAASDASAGQTFGFSLAVENDKAVIGAATGRAAYVFTRSSGTWSEQDRFVPPSGGATTDDKFPVSLSNGTFVIGASGDSEADVNSGAAYVYVLNTPPTISPIADQIAYVNMPINISVIIGDAETPLNALTVNGTSSNAALVRDADLIFAGTGAYRILTINPLTQSGTTVITVTVSDGIASTSVSFTLTIYNTPAGGNVTVTPAQGVTVMYSQVVTGGETTVAASTTNPGPVSEGFVFLGTYYDIIAKPPLTYSGPITICLSYVDIGMTPEQEAGLQLWHLMGGVWTLIDEALTTRDTVNNSICGTVNSLSWFGIGVDTTASTFKLNSLKDTLWPSEHKLVKVATVTDVYDAIDPSPRVDIQVASSDVFGKDKDDEHNGDHHGRHKDRDGDDDHGRDHHKPDWTVKKKGSTWEIWVRPEVSEKSKERIYTITATVSDKSGNQAIATNSVRVALDKERR